MKYCPFCGAELYSGTACFCSQCGKQLKGSDEPPAEAAPAEHTVKKPATVKKRHRKRKAPKPPKQKKAKNNQGRAKEHNPAFAATPTDKSYDGYYDDVLPPDSDRVQDGLDQELVKKVVALCVGVTVIISLCVALLYIL